MITLFINNNGHNYCNHSIMFYYVSLNNIYYDFILNLRQIRVGMCINDNYAIYYLVLIYHIILIYSHPPNGTLT